MRLQCLLFSMVVVGLLGFFAGESQAQLYQRQIQAPRVRTSYPVPVPRYSASFYRKPIAKPFKNIQQRPTVSPYLNLVRDDSGAAANYQTLVRPQMEQLEINRQQELQINRLDRQFQDFRQESAFPQQGSEDIRATGHATRFMNRSHFYPE